MEKTKVSTEEFFENGINNMLFDGEITKRSNIFAYIPKW